MSIFSRFFRRPKAGDENLTLRKTRDFCASGSPKLTVVFIHGIASDSSAFRNALRYLEGTRSMKDVRFVTFDLLGTGKSCRASGLKYGYTDQLIALHNAIMKLRVATPLVLVGHSMGTLVAVRYAYEHKKSVAQLILCSPPVYTEQDLDNPAFEAGMKAFRDAVSAKNRRILKDKAFNNMMEYIVKNRKNYKVFATLTTHAVMIYGDADPFIMAQNIEKVAKENPKYLSVMKTSGRHGMSREKYGKIPALLERMMND
ncbi:alpha/beta fold hydrolase [Candidatus Saccharibacteria bacterium]|nr:alpha/beta fold hydrolase [Candidatus Saccharibacteria bacterium]